MLREEPSQRPSTPPTSPTPTLHEASLHSSSETLAQSGESAIDDDGVNVRYQGFQLENPPRNRAEQYVQAIYHDPTFRYGLLELYGLEGVVDEAGYTVPQLVAFAANLVPELPYPPPLLISRGSSSRETESQTSSGSVSQRSSLEIRPPSPN